MLRTIISLAFGVAVLAAGVEAAPLNADSGGSKSRATKFWSFAHWDASALWSWVANLAPDAKAGAEPAGQPEDGAAPTQPGEAGPSKGPGKPGSSTGRPADKDDAREKTGPEPLPFAF